MTKQNHFLYIIEAIACLSIIFIHAQIPSSIGTELKILSRFAVPLFFLISGYYNYFSSKEKLVNRVKKMIKTFIFFSSIYLLIDFIFMQAGLLPIDFEPIDLLYLIFFNYTNFICYHLWFLLALIYTYVFNIIFYKKKFSLKILIITLISIILFYVLEYLFKDTIERDTILVLTRNWITIGIPFYYVGRLLKPNAKYLKISNFVLIITLVLGIIFTNAEYLFLTKILDFKEVGDLFLGTILIDLSLFILTLKNPSLIKNKFLEKIGKDYTLYIYLIHPLIIRIIYQVLIKYYGININRTLIPFIVIILSYIVVVGIDLIKNNLNNRCLI